MQILIPTLKKELEYLRKKWGANDDNLTFALKMLAKLTEETGEVAEAILGTNGMQRKSKDQTYDIGDELADVIIVAVLLALQLDINIYKKLIDKLNTLENKHE